MSPSEVPVRTEFDDRVEWHLDGQLHREDGPAVEWFSGSRHWWWHGQLHRDGGPAREYADGSLGWWCHGKRHRMDGYAVETPYGDGNWWIDGVELNWNKETGSAWMSLTPDQQTFVRAHLHHVGTGRMWHHWEDLFTSARDTCPAPVKLTRAQPRPQPQGMSL